MKGLRSINTSQQNAYDVDSEAIIIVHHSFVWQDNDTSVKGNFEEKEGEYAQLALTISNAILP